MNCRICKGSITIDDQLLILENMPSSAQGFLKKEDLEVDRAIPLELYVCSYCQVVQHFHEPVIYYKDVIRANAYSSSMKAFRLNQLKEFLNKFDLEKKMALEPGCGKGEFLELLNSTGYSAFGVENNFDSVNVCIEKGLNVEKGYFGDDNIPFVDKKFEAFFLFSFLEHIPDISIFLKNIKSRLSKNAVGLIEVPNFDMILEKKMFSEFILDHIFYFKPETIKNVLSMNGFEVLDCKTIWHDYIISLEVKLRAPIQVDSFKASLNILKNNLSDFFISNQNENIAVWGGGHQSLAILSMFTLNKKVDYIIDSAEFKQHLYTPGSHIYVISPNEIDVRKISCILCIAGSYNKEVVATIKKINPTMKVFYMDGNDILDAK